MCFSSLTAASTKCFCSSGPHSLLSSLVRDLFVQAKYGGLNTFSGEQSSSEDGYIEPSRPREELRQDPYPLPKEFEWTTVDINEPAQVLSSLPTL